MATYAVVEEAHFGNAVQVYLRKCTRAARPSSHTSAATVNRTRARCARIVDKTSIGTRRHGLIGILVVVR